MLTANVLKGVVAANATFDQSTVTVFPTALGSLDSFLCHVASEKLFCTASYLKKTFIHNCMYFQLPGKGFPSITTTLACPCRVFFWCTMKEM